jgi:hypothetical protein
MAHRFCRPGISSRPDKNIHFSAQPAAGGGRRMAAAGIPPELLLPAGHFMNIYYICKKNII